MIAAIGAACVVVGIIIRKAPVAFLGSAILLISLL